MAGSISLIVCTLGRTEPLARLLVSLQAQTNPAFEVIVVDQNEPDLAAFLQPWHGRLALRHLHSAKGLSRARNVGLREAGGAIVGFPDDDCWYDAEVTAQVEHFFRDNAADVLTGRTLDRAGRESVSPHRSESGQIDRDNVFRSGNSNTLFARRAVAEAVGGFDEALGVGAATPFQSGEETDFLLKCLRNGHRAYYDRSLVVRHDQNEAGPANEMARVRAYSQGFGRVVRTHDYGVGYLGARTSRAAVRGLLCLASGDLQGARHRWLWAIGACLGYAASGPPTARSG
jgi:glycosyltransferase involved in cell wall biosynthesis